MKGSARAYARHRGVSHVAVLKAKKEGRIPVEPDGQIDFARADRAWAMNTDTTKPLNSVTGNPKHRRGRGEPPAPMGSDGADQDGSSPYAGWARNRAVREAYAAAREKLAYERETGALIRIEDAKKMAFEMTRRVREHLLAMPAKVSPLLIGIEDIGQVERVIEAEVRRALLELSEDLSRPA